MTALQIEWLAIAAMGVVTFATRVLGTSLARWIPRTPRWNRFMQALPGTLLVAIVAPSFVTGDRIHLIAAIVTLALAMRGAHLVVAMTAGVACVALLRAFA